MFKMLLGGLSGTDLLSAYMQKTFKVNKNSYVCKNIQNNCIKLLKISRERCINIPYVKRIGEILVWDSIRQAEYSYSKYVRKQSLKIE